MFLAVLTCLVTSSLIIFFLFPRPISVQPAGLNSSTVAFDVTDINLNITVGGWMPAPLGSTPPCRQLFSIALIWGYNPRHRLPGILWHPGGVEGWGEAGATMSPITDCVGLGLYTVRGQNRDQRKKTQGAARGHA